MALKIGGGLFQQDDVRETPDTTLQVGDFCSIFSSGDITNGDAETDLDFDSEESDDSAMHSVLVDTERITVTKSGVYLILANIPLVRTGTEWIIMKLYEGATVIKEQTRDLHVDIPLAGITFAEVRKVTAATYYKLTSTNADGVDITGGTTKDVSLTVIKLI